ncbi:MAG: hypothetical protein V4773_27710 [Verrucomicrobiota bacterium]
MTALTANVRKAAADATLQFDWLLGDKEFFRVGEIAGRLDLSTTKVEEMFADWCHRYPAGLSAEKKREERRLVAASQGKEIEERGPRLAMRVPRAFVVHALVTSARYTAADKLNAITSLATQFSAEECLQIATAFMQQAQLGPR